ncbi:MAG TPA: hypothetical protein VMV45_07615 [Casimicrobiaceae bacterium]|nr:hypothetical protein [Casimicrobiaceae bacterium]
MWPSLLALLRILAIWLACAMAGVLAGYLAVLLARDGIWWDQLLSLAVLILIAMMIAIREWRRI